MDIKPLVLASISLLISSPHASLACDAHGAAREIASAYVKKIPLASVPDAVTPENALSVQRAFVKAIEKDLGRPIGYKAGITSESARKRFGMKEPVVGFLLQGMMVQSGARLSASFGAVPAMEGDLLVRVGDERINEAKTRIEALASLDVAMPFMELPDLMYSKGVTLSGPAIMAVNVGARYGVMGNPIALSATEDWVKRLSDFTIEIRDEAGIVLATGRGDALMGHPLDVVLWLRDSLRRDGVRLGKGDLLSLGALTEILPVRPGKSFSAIYSGLDPKGDVRVDVGFE